MAEQYTPEHERVSSILHAQHIRLDVHDEGTTLIKTKWAREAIHGITMDLAVMYRENDPEFDFPRFIRTARFGA